MSVEKINLNLDRIILIVLGRMLANQHLILSNIPVTDEKTRQEMIADTEECVNELKRAILLSRLAQGDAHEQGHPV